MTANKPTDRRAIRSRKMLQEALIKLIGEKPYEKIRITEITEAADLARVTFYSHFDTKDDLLISILDETMDVYFVRDLNRFYPAADNEMESRRKDVEFFETWLKNEKILALIKIPHVEILFSNYLRNRHENIYQEIIQPQRPEVNPVFAGYWINFMTSTKMSLLTYWLNSNLCQSPEVMGDLLTSLTGISVFEKTLAEFKDRLC